MIDFDSLTKKEVFKTLDEKKKEKLTELVKSLEGTSFENLMSSLPKLNKQMFDVNLSQNEKKEIMQCILKSLDSNDKKRFENILKLMRIF